MWSWSCVIITLPHPFHSNQYRNDYTVNPGWNRSCLFDMCSLWVNFYVCFPVSLFFHVLSCETNFMCSCEFIFLCVILWDQFYVCFPVSLFLRVLSCETNCMCAFLWACFYVCCLVRPILCVYIPMSLFLCVLSCETNCMCVFLWG